MAIPSRALAVLVPLLTFVLGFLLGARPAEATGSEALLENQAEQLRLLRDLQRNASASQASRDVASVPRSQRAVSPDGDAAGSVRLPSLDPWLQRIDGAVQRLEEAAERASKTAPVDPAQIVRRAADPNLPRNDRELKLFIREVEAVDYGEFETNEDYDRAWEALQAKYRYQPMEDMLERFGRPDDIELEAGAVHWYYSQETPKSGGEVEIWEVQLSFYDNALVDFHGYWE